MIRFIPKSKHIGLLSCSIPARRRLIVAPVSAVSREGDLRPMDKGKTLRALKLSVRGLKPGAVHAVYENSDHARLGEGGFGAL
jgi:hypothetical protein